MRSRDFLTRFKGVGRRIWATRLRQTSAGGPLHGPRPTSDHERRGGDEGAHRGRGACRGAYGRPPRRLAATPAHCLRSHWHTQASEAFLASKTTGACVHAQEKKEEKKEEKEVKVVKKPDEVRRGPAFAVSKNMALAYAVAEPADAARAEQRRTQRARVPSTVPCRAGSPRHSQTRLLRACQNVMKEKISVEEEKMGKLQEKLTAIKEQLDKDAPVNFQPEKALGAGGLPEGALHQ